VYTFYGGVNMHLSYQEVKRKEGTMGHYVMKAFEGFEWKILASVFGTVVAYIEGFYTELIWSFLALFTLDLITGIMKSKRNGIPISSKRLRDSVSKLGAYIILITALIIASKMETQFVPVVTLAYYYFIFTEFKSIIENVEEMGLKVPGFLKSKVDEQIPQDSTEEEKERGDR
jgi:toxin secretion/phage lysis holin